MPGRVRVTPRWGCQGQSTSLITVCELGQPYVLQKGKAPDACQFTMHYILVNVLD